MYLRSCGKQQRHKKKGHFGKHANIFARLWPPFKGHSGKPQQWKRCYVG